MRYTSDLLEECVEGLNLGPTQEIVMKNILKSMDGEEIEDDLEEDE